jgi:hypothetical protein
MKKAAPNFSEQISVKFKSNNAATVISAIAKLTINQSRPQPSSLNSNRLPLS